MCPTSPLADTNCFSFTRRFRSTESSLTSTSVRTTNLADTRCGSGSAPDPWARGASDEPRAGHHIRDIIGALEKCGYHYVPALFCSHKRTLNTTLSDPPTDIHY